MLDLLRPSPPLLWGLLTGTDPRSSHFRKKIRHYNTALSFTSVSATKDDRVDLLRGVQTYSIHGELFHFQGPLIPRAEEPPAFAQLFFYDPDYAAGLRLNQHPGLDRTLLRDLHQMITEVNPFVQLYKTARSV